MAVSASSCSLNNRTSTQMQFVVAGLSNPPNLYTQFRVTIGAASYTWTDSATTGTTSVSPWFGGLTPGTNYTIFGYATFNTVEYTLNNGSSFSNFTNDPPTNPSGFAGTTFPTGNKNGTITWSTNGVYYTGITQVATELINHSFSGGAGAAVLAIGGDNKSVTMSGTNYSTTYSVTITSTDPAGATNSIVVNFTTGATPPTPIATPTVTLSSTTTTISYTQSSVANANYYYVELWDAANTTMIYSNGSFSPNVGSWTGLTSGKNFTVRNWATTTTAGFSDSAVTTHAIATQVIPSISAPTVSLSPSGTSIGYTQGSVANANTYYLELWNAADTVNIYASSGPSPLVGTWTNLTISTNYVVRSSATTTNPNYSNSPVVRTNVSTTANARPSNFSWTNVKTSGQTVNLTAAEWNGLTQRIRDFQTYKSVALSTFTSAVPGGAVTAVIMNQAVTALGTMNPPTVAPSSVVSGGNVNASFYNGLVSSLNSIP